MKERSIFLILPVIFLAACAGQASLVLSPTAPSPVKMVFSSPTSQSTPTFVFTSTPDFVITPDPPATVSAMETIDAASAMACDNPEPAGGMSLSPSGLWVAIVCKLNPGQTRATNTKVFRLDGTASWDVPFYEIYGRSAGIRDGTMGIFHWSKDGQFAYFIPYFCCLDVPQSDFFNYFRTSAGLYRLDLSSGKVTMTLPPDLGDIFAGYAFSFSPNDKYLVYHSPRKHNEIDLYTLKTGKIEKVNLADKYWVYGGFAWSIDSKELAFVASRNELSDQSLYAYFAMHISDLSPNLLVEKEDINRLWWTQENNLMFGDSSLFDFSDNSFIVISTPTP